MSKFLTKAGCGQVCVLRSAAIAASAGAMKQNQHSEWNYGRLCGIATAARLLGLQPEDIGIRAWPTGTLQQWRDER